MTLLAATSAAQPSAASSRFVGTWQGTLVAGTARLRLAFDVTRDSAGALRAIMRSVDQGNAPIPASVRTSGDTLAVAVPLIQGSYQGVLAAASDSLRGTFTQGAPLSLTLGRTATYVMRRPQLPQPPFPYRSEEVAFESVPGVQLAGTVVTPEGTGPFPAVVFVTGSGAQDRDETLFGHKPFLVLADHLARHGVASLRLDDRGVGQSTGTMIGATSADFADDAEAGVRFLRGRAGIARESPSRRDRTSSATPTSASRSTGAVSSTAKSPFPVASGGSTPASATALAPPISRARKPSSGRRRRHVHIVSAASTGTAASA